MDLEKIQKLKDKFENSKKWKCVNCENTEKLVFSSVCKCGGEIVLFLDYKSRKIKEEAKELLNEYKKGCWKGESEFKKNNENHIVRCGVKYNSNIKLCPKCKKGIKILKEIYKK